MRLYEIICEGRDADLYHGTSLEKLNRLLQDNVLYANTPIHSDLVPKQLKHYKKTVSLTRNSAVATNFARAASIKDDSNDSTPVILVLDQAKLYNSAGKRMKPYDDLESLDKTYSSGETSSRSRGPNEAEEVVFGSIDNIKSYIKKIIIQVPSDQAKVELQKYKNILNDPRVIVTDYVNKSLTGRQFMSLASSKK